MPSNRVAAFQSPRTENEKNLLRPSWIGIIPVLVLALGLGGCALNSTGLPGGLPVPPGGGTLTFTRSTLVNGIQGRTYTIWIPTTGGSGTLSGCTIIAGSLPAGLSIAISADPPATAAVSFCKITGTITTVGPATVSFTVQATDTASNTASQSLSIAVRPDFTVTTSTAFLDGVAGRTYGNPAAPDLKTPQPVNTSVSATVGNAPLSTCAFTIAGNPGFNLAPAPTGAVCNLSSGATALTAAGPFSVTLAATDTDLLDTFAGQTTKIVVPKATKTSAALALTVQAALTMALTQSTNATPTTALFNAVSGRRYGTGAQAAAAPTYAAAGGLTTGGTYNWCISVGALPAGFASAPTALSACPTTASIAVATAETVTAATAGAAGGPTAFTLQVADVANAAVSSGTATAGTALTINAVLSLAANFNNPVPDAVVGRTWGGVGFTSLVYTAAGGDGAYTFTAPPTAGAPVAGSFPTPMACAPATTTLTCSSAAVTGTPGGYTNAPASVDDAGNAAVPGSASVAATAAVTRSLTVRSEFTITTVTAFLNGVQGRTYGNPAPPDLKTPQPVVTDVSATVGNAPLTTCVFTVAASNPGFNLTPTPVGGNTCELSSGPATLAAAGGFTVALAATDSPITDPVSTGAVVPAKTISNSGAPLPLIVDPALTLTLTQSGNATPNTALLLAVESRSYGVVGGTPTYAGSGGLGSSLNYDWCVTGALPAGFVTTPAIPACATTILLPIAASVTVTSPTAGAAGGPTAFTLQIGDGSNAAVAAGIATAATALTVAPPISFSLAPAPTGVAPNGIIPDGVVGRTYGTPLANLVFTASGGLANAPGVGLQGAQTGTLSANGINCNPTTPQVGASVTVTCNTGGGPVTTPSGAGRTLIMTFSDAGSTAVPAGSTSTDTAGFTIYSNTIADALAIALQAGSPDPANANAQAVVGRTYGKAPEAPVVYEATNGLTPYTFVRSGTLLANSNICGIQNATATTLTCDSGGVAVTGTTGSLTVTVNDTGTATTPSGSAALTETYTVNPAVSLSVTPDPALASSTAVVGRLYGAPAGGAFSSPTYTAAGGLGLFTFIHTGTLEANTNIVCTDAAPTVTCESGVAVTGTAPFPETEPFTLQVTDGSNLTTPADPVGDTLTKNFTINDLLAITTTSLKNGLVNFTYVPTGPGITLAATGGLGGNTWVAGGTVGACSPSGTPPTGLSLGAATGTLSGVPIVISTLTTDFTFDVCVEDTANTTTPSGTDTHANYVVNVMDTLAATANLGNDTVSVINTTTNASPATSIALTAGDSPFGVAVTPDGRKLYVTLNGPDDVAIIDTITGAVTTLGGLGTCTNPQGIAIGMPNGVPTAFVACNNRRIAVIDASTDTLLTSANYGSASGDFYGVAFTPDDSKVYVTDQANDEFVVLNALDPNCAITSCPSATFAAGVTTPHGVAISIDGARVYLAGSGSDNVIAISTADNTTIVSTGAAAILTGAGSAPEQIAVTPSGTHVFVTLIGADKFAVFNDSATPSLNTIVSLAGGTSPSGVTVPPIDPSFLTTSGFRVYFAQFSTNNVAIHNDEIVTPFGANGASPIALTPPATPNPNGITHIPVPR